MPDRPDPGPRPDRAQLKGHLDLLLLAVLQTAPAHGYEIIGALRDRSRGVFDLPEGTVYPALHRLEAAGYLTSTWRPVEGRRRRIYQLTPDGSSDLDTQRTAWRCYSSAVEATLHGGSGPGRPDHNLSPSGTSLVRRQ